MIGWLRLTVVKICEKLGWLNIVDQHIVDQYLNPESAAIRMLEELFKNSYFMSASPTPITCIEVAKKSGYVAIRDSKDLKKKALYFTNAEWEAFVTGVKDGKFDFVENND